jgi:hypothetical protein
MSMNNFKIAESDPLLVKNIHSPSSFYAAFGTR